MKAWVLTVCIACIATAVLQAFTEGEKQNRNTVIKTVFTLYILVLVLSPAGGAKIDWQAAEVQPQAAAQVTPQQLAMAQAQQTLEASVATALQEKLGVAANVHIRLDGQDPADIRVASVQVALLQAADEAAVRSCVAAVLGTQTEMTITQEG